MFKHVVIVGLALILSACGEPSSDASSSSSADLDAAVAVSTPSGVASAPSGATAAPSGAASAMSGGGDPENIGEGEMSDTCAVIESGNWAAWIDAMPSPEGGKRLNVSGEIVLPTPGYEWDLVIGAADRMNPPAQHLQLKLTPPDGIVAQVLTTYQVTHRSDAVYPEYRAILIKCGDKQLAEITDIETAH